MHYEQRKYSLMTAIAMIVGIVIGSGIFFKVDDILINSGGNVLLGGLAFVLGALAIVFGGLCLATYAKMDDKAGGVITYIESIYGKRLAFITGWFQALCYFPALGAVVTWVAALYTTTLFSQFNLNVWFVTLFYIGVLFLLNIYAPKVAGYFQTSTTFIKLIPLLILAVLGLMFGQVDLDPSALTATAVFGASSAIVSVAFAYDGWSIAPSIAHEIKDSKRNLPIALIISPILIMIVYLFYYFGVIGIVGAENVMSLGDNYIYEAFNLIFGPAGAKCLLVFVIISVLGTSNGIILAGSRVPYALAIRKELPFSKQLTKQNKHLMPYISSLVFLVITLFWLFIHYLSSGLNLFVIDVTELPIVIIYMFYTLLFIGVIVNYTKKKITNHFEGIIAPVLAIIGAGIVLYGGFTSPSAPLYLMISLIIIVSGLVLFQIMTKKEH